MPKPILSNDLGTQISKLTGCGFTRIGNLNFNFPYGGCFSTPNEIVLCFSSLETDQCRRGTDPLGEFETISNSVYQHSYIRLSASEGKFSSILREHLHKVACKTICFFSISLECLDTAFALGQYNYHSHFELLDLRNWSWESRSDYPFRSSIYAHANIVLDGNFIVFGGANIQTIAKFDVTQNSWSKLGDLRQGRYAPNVILSDGFFLVFGDGPTEKCELSDNTMSCIKQSTTVPNHLQLFHVAEDFCQI